MKAFVIVALVAAVSGEADPYTIGQVIWHKNKEKRGDAHAPPSCNLRIQNLSPNCLKLFHLKQPKNLQSNDLQVLAGQTNGGVLTSTTYHGGVKVRVLLILDHKVLCRHL